MPNPVTNFKNSNGQDIGIPFVTKEYLLSVYPQIANTIITPELWVWGRNDNGVLGINNITNCSTPVSTFSGGATWKQISCGYKHAAAIKRDGSLWIWGHTNYGKLGEQGGSDRLTPITTFAGGTNWQQVSCGYTHTLAVKTDGTLWTWGRNNAGQLGDGTTTNRFTPVTTFSGGNNWKLVSSGYRHSAAIKTDGTLWTWGDNGSGQLGINLSGFGTNRTTPVTTFAGGNNWMQLSCGSGHMLAIKTDGTLWAWGYNSAGEIGDGNQGSFVRTPVTTSTGGTNWRQISAGNGNSAAIKSDGTLWTWGSAQYGVLGNNQSMFGNLVPKTTFAGGTSWKQVSVSHIGPFGKFTAAVKTDGTLWVWGRNSYATLGNNNTSQRDTPVTTFLGGANWKQVDCGDRMMAGIRSYETL